MSQDNTIQKSAVRNLSFGGVLLAVLIIDLYLSNVLPTSRLSLLVISSFIMAVAVIELGKRYLWIFYISASILAILFMPDKVKAIIFVTFFGLYPIIRFYIDKINKIVFETILKFLYFNIFLIFFIGFAYTFLVKDLGINFPIYIIVLIGQVAFFAYDFLFTSFISFYFSRIKNKIKL